MIFQTSQVVLLGLLNERYEQDELLKKLGTKESLVSYLQEEIAEAGRQNKFTNQGWDIPIDHASNGENSTPNPHNVLAYYLLRIADAPKKLSHHWEGGDYPDIDCLYEKTVIKTENGNRFICNLKKKDIIFNKNGEKETILLIQRRKLKINERIFILDWDDGSQTIASEFHRFIFNNKEKTVLELNEKINKKKKEKSGSRILVSIRKISVPADTYFCDISVTGDHSFQLANGAISHNCDFDPDRRDEILLYLQDKYGKDKVLKTATWGASGIKGSIQDLSKVVSRDVEVDGVVKTIRPEWKTITNVTKHIDIKEAESEIEGGEETTLDWVEKNVEGAAALFRDFPDLKKWAQPYGKVLRSSGQHAGAMVICSEPLGDFLPIIRTSDGDEIIGLSEAGSSGKKELQPQGAIKYDFLGLANLRVLHEAEKLVEQKHNIHFDEVTWHQIGFDHPKVYDLARKGELDGIFQFEKTAGRKTTAQVQPRTFGDLSFINAGMRPGAAMANAPVTYNRHMNGMKDPNYPDYRELANYGVDEQLLKFLGETYGTVVYQEQTMQFLHFVAGFSFAETNKFRKAIATTNPEAKKKLQPYLDKAFKQYMEGAQKRGMSEDLSRKWWNMVCGQAEYSFNRSHCVSYALIAFRQLFLKTYFPTEFFCALINQLGSGKKKKDDTTSVLGQYIMAAKRLGVTVTGPDINLSWEKASVVGDSKIAMGLSHIKFCGAKPIADIIQRRIEGYKSFDHFLEVHGKIGDGEKSSVNKRVIEALVKSGAFAKLHPNTSRLDLWNSYLFAIGSDRQEMKWSELVEAEREYAGFVFHETPFTSQNNVEQKGFVQLENASTKVGRFYCIGLVKNINTRKTKKGKKFFIVTLTNFRVEVDFTAWEESKLDKMGVKNGDALTIEFFLNEKGYLNITDVLNHHQDMIGQINATYKN